VLNPKFRAFTKSAKSFDLALKMKKIKQNKKFWLSAYSEINCFLIPVLTIA
jgi:hypothetical protein